MKNPLSFFRRKSKAVETELEKTVIKWLDKEVYDVESIQRALEIEKTLQPMLEKYNERAKKERPHAVVGGSSYHLAIYNIAKYPDDYDMGDMTKITNYSNLLKEAIKSSANFSFAMGAAVGIFPSHVDRRHIISVYVKELDEEHFFE